MTGNAHTTDVIIIGAGPVGLFAAFQCGMVRLSTHVVDVLEDIGGQCAALYPEKPIYDIPGFSSVTGAELISRLETQAETFKPTYHLNQRVEKLTREADGRWTVETSLNTRITAPAIIIAAGAGAFGPNRPPLDGLEGYEGRSVFYMVRKRDDFKGKRVVIAGGGDSAVDWAISLSEVARSVAVVHRRDKFRCAPSSSDLLHKLANSGRIELVTPYQLHGLEGDGRALSGVAVATLDGQIRTLPADALLPFFGLATDLGPIAHFGLNMDAHHIVVEPTTCQTSAPGVFAIGDVAHYPHKLKLILTGFAEAAQAAHAAFAVVHPDESLHFEHSTSMSLPGK